MIIQAAQDDTAVSVESRLIWESSSWLTQALKSISKVDYKEEATLAAAFHFPSIAVNCAGYTQHFCLRIPRKSWYAIGHRWRRLNDIQGKNVVDSLMNFISCGKTWKNVGTPMVNGVSIRGASPPGKLGYCYLSSLIEVEDVYLRTMQQQQQQCPCIAKPSQLALLPLNASSSPASRSCQRNLHEEDIILSSSSLSDSPLHLISKRHD